MDTLTIVSRICGALLCVVFLLGALVMWRARKSNDRIMRAIAWTFTPASLYCAIYLLWLGW